MLKSGAEQLQAAAKPFTLENILFILDSLQDVQARLKSGTNARTEMEMAFIKLASPKLNSGTSALLERVSKLEQALKSGNIRVQTQPTENDITAQQPAEPVRNEPPAFKNESEKRHELFADLPKREAEPKPERPIPEPPPRKREYEAPPPPPPMTSLQGTTFFFRNGLRFWRSLKKSTFPF